MNKIFNWTLGSVFRTLGRCIAYLLVGALFALIMSKSGLKITDLLGIDTIKATTLSYDMGKFYVAGVNNLGQEQDWTTAFNLGQYVYYNEFPLNTLEYLSSIRVRLGVNNKFQQGTTYTVKINTIWGESGNGSLYQNPRSIICQGSSTSTWSSDENLVNCEYIGRTLYNDNKNASYYFKITPISTIYGIQIAWYYKKPPNEWRLYLPGIDNIRVLTSTKITYDNSTNEAINSMSENITINQNKNTEQIINNQNELLGNKCANLMNFNNGQVYKMVATQNDQYKVFDNFVKLEGGKQYYFEYFSNKSYGATAGTDTAEMYLLKDKQYTILLHPNSQNGVLNVNTTGNYYVRFDCNKSGETCTFYNFMISEGRTTKPYCEYGSTQSKLDDTNNAINGLNDTMKDDDSSGAQSEAGDFFSDFSTNTHGLTGIITAPLNAIQSLTSKSCSPLVLPLPFVNQNLTLPCMRAIYVDTFGGFMNIYDIIVIGIISYWIMVRIFAMVKDFKNPEHDEVEVVDL